MSAPTQRGRARRLGQFILHAKSGELMAFGNRLNEEAELIGGPTGEAMVEFGYKLGLIAVKRMNMERLNTVLQDLREGDAK